MITTYRYVKKQIDKKKETQAAQTRDEPVPMNVLARPGEPSHTSENVESSVVSQTNASGSSSLKWKIMLMAALAMPVFLETLDYTVVATAQVHIASVFNRLDLQSYIGTIYLLTSTVFLPLFASFADVFGRHWTLQLSLLLFLVGSAISTGSMNMPTMLAGRGVAGIGAAGLLAVVRIILTDSRSLDDNNWQQSIMFVLYTVGFCLGPFIGGELVTVSFRWVFAINLPCAAFAMVLAFFLLRGRVKGGQTAEQLPSSSNDHLGSAKIPFLSKILQIDWVGGALFMAGGILILLALNWGSTEQWDSAKVIACFIIGGLLFILFGIWERHIQRRVGYAGASTLRRALYTQPMIPIKMFKSLDLCINMFAVFVSGMIQMVMFYFIAIFMTIVADLPPNQAGVQLLYFAPGMGGGALIAIYWIKVGRQPKPPILLSGVVSTVALGLIAYAMNLNKQNQVNGFLAMSGAGVGLGMGPLAVHARFSQPEEHVAIVSALTLFFRTFGGTVGLAQCGAVLNGRVRGFLTDAITSGLVNASDAQAISSVAGGGDVSSVQDIDSLPSALQILVRDAYRDGSRWCFISLIPWAGVAFIATKWLSDINDQPTAQEERADTMTEALIEDEENRTKTQQPDPSKA